jgi:hypothetical protein
MEVWISTSKLSLLMKSTITKRFIGNGWMSLDEDGVD